MEMCLYSWWACIVLCCVACNVSLWCLWCWCLSANVCWIVIVVLLVVCLYKTPFMIGHVGMFRRSYLLCGSCTTIHNIFQENSRESTNYWLRYQFHTSTWLLRQKVREIDITKPIQHRKTQYQKPISESRAPVSATRPAALHLGGTPGWYIVSFHPDTPHVNTIPPDTAIHEQMTTTKWLRKSVYDDKHTFNNGVRPLWTITWMTRRT